MLPSPMIHEKTSTGINNDYNKGYATKLYCHYLV